MSKIDRCIFIGAVGVLLVSMVYLAAAVKRQSVEKENLKFSKHEQMMTDTQNTMIWREYHHQQMAVLNAILTQLKENKVQKVCL